MKGTGQIDISTVRTRIVVSSQSVHTGPKIGIYTVRSTTAIEVLSAHIPGGTVFFTVESPFEKSMGGWCGTCACAQSLAGTDGLVPRRVAAPVNIDMFTCRSTDNL